MKLKGRGHKEKQNIIKPHHLASMLPCSSSAAIFLHAANCFIGYFLFFSDFTTGQLLPSPEPINMVLD